MTGRLPYLWLSLAFLLLFSGCDLGADSGEGGDANFLTFSGTAPDGRPNGFPGDVIPMVDSTITIRALLGDTTTSRAGQGLPASRGRIRWTVSDGRTTDSLSTVGSNGLATTRWTLGTDASQQRITATLVEGETPGISTTLTLEGQGAPERSLYPGPPERLQLVPASLALREGESAAVSVSSLEDRYGNPWALDIFRVTPTTSDSGIIGIERVTGGETPRITVRATGAGTARITLRAEGTLDAGRRIDFAGFDAETDLSVTVEALPGFLASFTSIQAGEAFACGIAGPGTAATPGVVYCWGANDAEQLARPDLAADRLRAPRPDLPVVGLPDGAVIRVLAAGGQHACAVLERGSVYCWGDNGSNQLGSFGREPGANRVLLDFNDDVPSANEPGFRDLVAGGAHTCVLGESGTVYCWGANDRGQLGTGSSGSNQILAQTVQGLGGIDIDRLVPVGARARHTCALSVEGALYCWGANESGQIGNGTTAPALVATPVAPDLGITYASAGTAANLTRGYTCGVASSGDLYCWGDRPLGPGPLSEPTAVPPGDGGEFTTVRTADDHACLLDVAGTAYCFGSATQGRLGNGASSGSVPVPVTVSGEQAFDDLRVGSSFSFGRLAPGATFAWGENGQGQLGIPTDQEAALTPVQTFFSTDP